MHRWWWWWCDNKGPPAKFCPRQRCRSPGPLRGESYHGARNIVQHYLLRPTMDISNVTCNIKKQQSVSMSVKRCKKKGNKLNLTVHYMNISHFKNKWSHSSEQWSQETNVGNVLWLPKTSSPLCCAFFVEDDDFQKHVICNNCYESSQEQNLYLWSSVFDNWYFVRRRMI